MRYKPGTFVVVPNKQVLLNQKPYVLAVYFWICSHANNEGTCFPSINTLANEAGMSRSQAKRGLNKLEELSILQKITRKTKDGKTNSTNLYQLLTVDDEFTQNGGRFKTVPQGKSSQSRRTESIKSNHLSADPASQATAYVASPKTKGPFEKVVIYFKEQCERRVGFQPKINKGHEARIRCALKDSGLTEKQALDLIDEWFGQNKRDDAIVQITHAFSDYQINGYKARNL